MKQLLSLLLPLLLINVPGPLKAAPKKRCVTIVGTNDLHGAISPHELKHRGKTLRKNGVIAQSGYIHRLREVFGDHLLLLDGGDLFQGTMASNLSRGEAVIDAYNNMGYTASAIGNHEFDYGPLTPDAADRLGTLKARLTQARFPFLAANIFESKTGAPVDWPNTHPTLLLTRGGVKVGLIGISTPQTPETTRLRNVSTLEFRAPLPIVTRHAKKLRSQGAELVVLLTHMGDRCRSSKDPHNTKSCTGTGELFKLLTGLPRGLVDVAVGGHTHGYIAHWINGVATIESGGHGRHLGMVEACVGPTNRLDPKRTTIHPPTALCIDAWENGGCGVNNTATKLARPVFLGARVHPTESMKKLMAPHLQRVQTEKARPLGITLPHPILRKAPGQKSLGYLVAAAAQQELKADVGIQNRGGVRTDLPKGDLNYGMLFEVLPFGNNLALLELTGHQLKGLIEHIAGRHNNTPPYITGLLAQRKRGGLALTHPDGSPLNLKRTYRVATTDFLANGGDGLKKIIESLDPKKITIGNTQLRSSVITLLKQRFPAAP